MFFTYLLSIIMFFNFYSMFMFWIFLEVNMICFLLLSMNISEENLKNNFMTISLEYFLIQSLGSFLILLSSSMEIYGFKKNMELILILSMCLKMGIFPFQFWVFKMIKFIPFLSKSMLLTFQKVPMLVFLSNFSLNLSTLIVFLSMMFGSIMMICSDNLSDMLISSSIYGTLWFFLALEISNVLFFIFLIMYFFSIFYFFKTEDMISNNLKSMWGKYSISLMFFLGLPPFGLFFTKLVIVNHMFFIFSNFMIMLIWISTFLTILSYFGNFYYLFFYNESIYKSLKSIPSNWMIFNLIMSSFIYLFF